MSEIQDGVTSGKASLVGSYKSQKTTFGRGPPSIFELSEGEISAVWDLLNYQTIKS